MSIAVDAEVVTRSLWPQRSLETALQANGQCLHVSTATQANSFSCYTVNPQNELQAVVGTSEGFLYGVSLKENNLFLLAKLEGRKIRTVSFFTGTENPTVIVVTHRNELNFFSWQTGRQVQEQFPAASMHKRPIQLITVNARVAPSSFLCISGDVVSCWMLAAPAPTNGSARFACVALTSPAQCAVKLAPRACTSGENTKADTPAERGGDYAPPHHFVTATFLQHHCLICTAETNGIVSLWSREESQRLSDSSTGAPPLHRSTKSNVIGSTTVSEYHLQRCQSTAPFQIAALDACEPFVALGSATAPAALAFLKTESLEGISQVRVPTKKPCSVQQIRIIEEELVVCTCGDGSAVGIAASNYQVVFVLDHPVPAERRFSVTAPWHFEIAGATFGTFWNNKNVYLYHLPTARAWYARAIDAMVRSGKVAAGDTQRLLTSAGEMTTKVVPFLRRQAQPSRRGEHSPKWTSGRGAAGLLSEVDMRLGRRALAVDGKKRAGWIDVNYAGTDLSSQAQADQRAVGQATARALFTDGLSEASWNYNMDKLRDHLLKYGSFPPQYRVVIWRFALGLPNKQQTLSQFAALSRNETHVAVAGMMRPYALPQGQVRATVEQALSVLCYHSPVFAMASFLPLFIYPLTHVFGEDVQSVVEAALVLFLNQGQDFFLCYPQSPTPLMLYFNYLLEKIDAELFAHLEQIGAPCEVWAWEVILSFYSDLFSGAEWLQLMDHALMMFPIFLFHIHTYYVHALRGLLLQTCSVDEVLAILRRPHEEINFGIVLESAYKYYQLATQTRSSEDYKIMKPYFQFRTLSPPRYEYPTEYSADEVVLGEKQRELQVLATERQAQRDAAHRLAQLDKEAAETTMRNEVILQQQRARVAAKYDASAESWKAYVEIESQRKEREEKERKLRLKALQTHVAQAEAMDHLEEELELVNAQVGHLQVDRFNEQSRWEVAARLTDNEMSRLETESRHRVAEAVQRLATTKYPSLSASTSTRVPGATAAPPSNYLPYQQQEPSSVSDVEEEPTEISSSREDAHQQQQRYHNQQHLHQQQQQPQPQLQPHGSGTTSPVSVVEDQSGYDDTVSSQDGPHANDLEHNRTKPNNNESGDHYYYYPGHYQQESPPPPTPAQQQQQQLQQQQPMHRENVVVHDLHDLTPPPYYTRKFITIEPHVDPNTYSSAIPRPPAGDPYAARYTKDNASPVQQIYQRLHQQAVRPNSTYDPDYHLQQQQQQLPLSSKTSTSTEGSKPLYDNYANAPVGQGNYYHVTRFMQPTAGNGYDPNMFTNSTTGTSTTPPASSYVYSTGGGNPSEEYVARSSASNMY